MKVVVGVIAALALAGAADDAAAAKPRVKPDLAVSSVTAPPGAAATVHVRDVVTLRGSVARATVGYFLSRDRARSRDDVRLAGGRVATARTRAGSARPAVPGRARLQAYYVLACADVANRVRERNERNNCRASRSRVTLLPRFRPDPLHVTEVLDEARTVSAPIGPAGGSLSATAADGTRFTLDVPAGALPRTEQIRMTPVASVAGLPAGGQSAGAVRFGPAGLELSGAAVLTVSPATPVPVAEQLPFATAAGRDLHAYPMLRDAALRLPIVHFSTFGVIRLGPSATDIVFRRTPSTRVAWAEQTLARALHDARVNGKGPEAYLNAAEVAFYVIGNEHVRPLLAAADDRASRRAALHAYISWRRQLDLLLGEPSGRLAALVGELTVQLQRMLVLLVEDELRRCETGVDPFAARDALQMARVVELWGIEVPNAVARATACLRFELTMTSSTEWTVFDYAHATASVRVANLILGADGSNAAPLESTGWSIELVGPLAGVGCTAASPSYEFDAPMLRVVEVDTAPGEAPERMYVDILPGNDRLTFLQSCPGSVLAATPTPVYGLVFATSHAAEKVGKDGSYRLTGWQRVAGSAWAAEARFDRSFSADDWSWTEQTRFFLRHAPVAAG